VFDPKAGNAGRLNSFRIHGELAQHVAFAAIEVVIEFLWIQYPMSPSSMPARSRSQRLSAINRA
jgi:hypothetical protein